MADLQFEEQQYQQVPQIGRRPFFVRLVLATGVVSDEKQAEYVLLGITVILLLIAILIPFFSNRQSAKPLPPGTTIIEFTDRPSRIIQSIPGS